MVTVGAVVVALGCLCVLAAAQGSLRQDSSRALAISWPPNAQSNIIVVPSPASDLPFPALRPARKPEFKIPALPPSVRSNAPPKSPTIPPGVYKTAPYSCIVVVPGPHPDDRCIIGRGGAEASMPIIKPDLRFIPRGPAEE